VRWIVFFSPSGAEIALRGVIAQRKESEWPKIATIGPTTQQFLIEKFNLEPDVVSPKPDPTSLVEAIKEYEMRLEEDTEEDEEPLSSVPPGYETAERQ